MNCFDGDFRRKVSHLCFAAEYNELLRGFAECS